MVVAVVVLAVVYVLTAVVGVALWLGLRQHQRLIDGFRKDFEHAILSVHERITSREERQADTHQENAQRIAQAHNTAAVAIDRLMFYTKHSAILSAIGAKYDKAIAKIRAQAEVKQPEPDRDSAPEGTAQSEGIAGSIGMPCG